MEGSLFCCCSTGEWTQGPTYVRQANHHWSWIYSYPWMLCSKCEHCTLPTTAQVSKVCTGYPVLIPLFLGCSRATSGSADPFLPPCHPSEPPWSSLAGAGGRCHLCFSLCSHSKTCSFCSNLVLLFSADFGLSATWFVSFLLPRKNVKRGDKERLCRKGQLWLRRAELAVIYTCS